MHDAAAHRPGKVLNPLLVLGTCGIISVLLDLDHIVVLVRKDLPITAGNLITLAGRPFHYAFLIVLGALCIYFGASCYRFLATRL